MRDKKYQMRVDDEFLKEIEYLRDIFDMDSASDVIRFLVKKEYRKEKDPRRGQGERK